MTKEQIMTELFEFSAPTYYKWYKKEKRKIFALLDYAFKLNELEEFLTNGSIKSVDNLAYINKFYDDSAQELMWLLYKSHHKGADNSYIFSLLADIISCGYEDLAKIKTIENFYTILFKDKKFDSDELFINVIKNSPISNQLFFYIKLNISENWTPLQQYLSKEYILDKLDSFWVVDYLELIKISHKQKLFDEIFFAGPGVRKLPNIPDPTTESTQNSILSSKTYSKIIKKIIKKIKNNTWDDDLFIGCGSKPFASSDPLFSAWLDTDININTKRQ